MRSFSERSDRTKMNYHLFKATRGPTQIVFLNWVLGKFVNLSHLLVNLSVESVINNAEQDTGLSDWGNEDYSRALNTLFQSCNEEANLTFWGRILFREKVSQILRNHLCIQNELKRSPQILNEKIKKPLIILGLPRSGTTLLHNLISQDPKMRYIRGWEARRPSLAPRFLGKKIDHRVKWGEKEIRFQKKYYPNLNDIHPMSNDGPEECHFLLAQKLTWEANFSILFNLPQYRRWAETHDPRDAYQYYYKILQLLQYNHKKEHWVLKSPDHLNHLATLLEIFPDACIVNVQRDLEKVLPSTCNLIAFGRLIHSRQIEFEAIGKDMVNRLGGWLLNAKKAMKTCNPGTIYNVDYHDLIADPVKCIRAIYKHFDYKYDPGMDDKIRKWLKENKPGNKAVNKYSLDQFGLDSSQIKNLCCLAEKIGTI